MKQPRTAPLITPYEEEMKKAEIPFSEYPRPQMRRDSYLCLNGTWDLWTIDDKMGCSKLPITVPFPPESRASGIGRLTRRRDRLTYRRSFTVPEDFVRGRVLLHFGAIDQTAQVFCNGVPVGQHTGGYLPFSFDVTKAVHSGANVICIHVTDPLDRDLPWGKQRYRRGGMWYTPISGIWQTVWLESVPRNAIKRLRMDPSLDRLILHVEGGAEQKTLTVETPEGELTHTFTGADLTLPIEHPRHWSPDDPYLYHFTLTAGEDRVQSYFALRTVEIQERNGRSVICLNGKPTFFHGLLDQGYFSDGLFLPATEQGFRDDILRMKACGFNMLRKHIKLEPELFYYYCDKYGMVVFQDLINNGSYHFLLDTALPTLGIRRGLSHCATPKRREIFLEEGERLVRQLYNHPCVVYYTIFNEGWGQFDADRVYDHFKALDPTRVWDTTSGWFKHKRSDVESDHVYFRSVKLKPVPGRPMVLSEFGGYACRLEGHVFNLDRNYGYRKYDDREEFERDLLALYRGEILPAIGDGLCASVLTQVSDVEDETNGLLTYDRAVCKVDEARMREMAGELYTAFEERFSANK